MYKLHTAYVCVYVCDSIIQAAVGYMLASVEEQTRLHHLSSTFSSRDWNRMFDMYDSSDQPTWSHRSCRKL